MKLRSQLAIAGVLIILLPLATARYIGELHDVLRDAGQRELQTWSVAVEAVINNSPNLEQGESSVTDIYAEYSNHEITLDGYQHDWSDLVQPSTKYHYADNKTADVVGIARDLAKVSLKSAVTDSSLYLLFDVQDKNVHFYERRLGSQNNGDRVLIYVGRGKDLKRYLLRAIAPGHLKAFQMLGDVAETNFLLPEPSIKAFWEVKPGGYSIEVEMPKPDRLSYFGFSLIDCNQQNDTSSDAWIGTVNPIDPKVSGRLKFRSENVESYIAGLAPEAARIRLFDEAGWLLTDINRLTELPVSSSLIDPNKSSLFDALLYRFFSWLMRDELIPEKSIYLLDGPAHLIDSGLNDGAAWRGRYKSSGKALMGEMRILKGESLSGYLLMERTDESIAVIVNSTLVRLFGVLLLLFFMLLIGLYLYASWISTRIRRLNNATAEALQQDGHIKIKMPDINSRDEIGELSMGISDLLSRLSAYTEYLRMLASRLAHELRTPLAVISTSLESVQREKLSDSDQVFLRRAEDATGRLQRIIRSMSEATRLEQAVQNAELAPFDLVDWLKTVVPLFQSLYPKNIVNFDCQKELSSAIVFASAELLQQMLDKVMANAADFTPSGERIEIRLHCDNGHYYLDVINEGSELPVFVNNQLFDAMVSQRKGEQSEPHLGLGLYIVRLVVEKHHGLVRAENTKDKMVRIRITLPAKDQAEV